MRTHPSFPLDDDESVINLRKMIDRHGYALVDPAFISGQGGDYSLAQTAFFESIRDIPSDLHSSKSERRRRYGLFIFHPWSEMLESVPPVWDMSHQDWVARYLQSGSLNPEHPNELRSFAPLTSAQRTNLFLRAAILRCFRALPWNEVARPVIVGVHIIQLVARPGVPGISSPDVLHRDGEPWTWAFLLERRDVTGGENVIAHSSVANRHPRQVDENAILERFTLTEVLAGYVVNDRRVSHYVAPVAITADRNAGWRKILLIDFSPAIPEIAS